MGGREVCVKSVFKCAPPPDFISHSLWDAIDIGSILNLKPWIDSPVSCSDAEDEGEEALEEDKPWSQRKVDLWAVLCTDTPQYLP